MNGEILVDHSQEYSKSKTGKLTNFIACDEVEESNVVPLDDVEDWNIEDADNMPIPDLNSLPSYIQPTVS